MTTIKMTEEQFDELLLTIKKLGPDTDKLEQKAKAKKSQSSFSKCSLRYSGQVDETAVENFITAVDMYKNSEEISDKDALRGMSLLFQGLAATWWKGVQRNINTWDEMLQALRAHFIPPRQIYEIYEELFQNKQSPSTPLDIFVYEKRALLSRLPEGLHDEATELNFIYALLNDNCRKEIPRIKIQTFKELLEKGRELGLNKINT